MRAQVLGKEPKFLSAPIGLFDAIIGRTPGFVNMLSLFASILNCNAPF